MKHQHQLRMKRALARDCIWDGTFWVARIPWVCLPSCSANHWPMGDTRFYDDLEAALADGFQPCQVCQPETYRWETRFCRVLNRRLDESPALYESTVDMAAHFGLTEVGLEALFRRHYHLDGKTYLMRHRLKRARTLMTTVGMSPTQVAKRLAWSHENFHSSFTRTVGMTADDFLRGCAIGELQAQLPQGYDVNHLLSHWGRDPQALDVRVSGRCLQKAVWVAGKPHCLAIELEAHRWYLHLIGPAANKPAAVGASYEMARRMLGLNVDVSGFEARAETDPMIAKLIHHQHGRTIPQTPDPFEGLVWVIVGQQVNLAFAYALRGALIQLCGSAAPADLIVHPHATTAADLHIDQLKSRRYSTRKAEYVIQLAHAVATGKLNLRDLATAGVPAATRILRNCRGLGPWSVCYLLMRSYGFGDVVPVGDAGLVKALQHFVNDQKRPDLAQTMATMRHFSPHRSLASFHFWATLERL